MSLALRGIQRGFIRLKRRVPSRTLFHSRTQVSSSQFQQLSLEHGFLQQEDGALDLRFLGDSIELASSIGLREVEAGIFMLPSTESYEDVQSTFRELQRYALRDHYVPYVEDYVLRSMRAFTFP